MDNLSDWILVVLGSGALGAVLVKVLDILSNRQRTEAETTKIAADTANISKSTEKMAAVSDDVALL